MQSLRHSRVLPVVVLAAGLVALTVTVGGHHHVRSTGAAHIRPVLASAYDVVSAHLSWVAGYGVIGLAVAAVALLIARRTHRGHDLAGLAPVALTAGILWPVLTIAFAQLGALALLRRFAASTGSSR